MRLRKDSFRLDYQDGASSDWGTLVKCQCFWRKFILHKLEAVWLRESGPRGLVQGEKLVFDLSYFPYL